MAYSTHTLLLANTGGYLAPPDLTNAGDGGAYTAPDPSGPLQSYTGYGGSANSLNNTDEGGGYIESQSLSLPGAFCAELFLVNLGDNAIAFEVSTTGDATSASRLVVVWEAVGGTFDAPLMRIDVYAKAPGGSQSLVITTDPFLTTAYGAFQHFALTRDASDLMTVSWGGVARGSATVPGAFSGTARWLSGSAGNVPSGNFLRGPVDSIRLVIGDPVYTSFPFTPSATELGVISGGDAVSYELIAEPASYAVTAPDVALSVRRALSFNAVSYALTAAAITLQVKRRLNVDAAAYTLDAPAVTLSVASGPAARVLDIEPADYALTAADVALLVSGTPPEPTTPGAGGFEMAGVRSVSFKPLLQRILEERAERMKPTTRRIAKRARTVEIEAAKVAMHDGGEEQFRGLMQRWLDQMQGLQNVADSEAYRVFMANVAFRINQMREAAEAAERADQDDEDALIALLTL